MFREAHLEVGGAKIWGPPQVIDLTVEGEKASEEYKKEPANK